MVETQGLSREQEQHLAKQAEAFRWENRNGVGRVLSDAVTTASDTPARRGRPIGAECASEQTNPFTCGLTLENVDDAFRYHPWHPGQADRGDQVRDVLVVAAKVILRNVPDSADRSAALRKIREVRMDCNSAITHEGRF